MQKPQSVQYLESMRKLREELNKIVVKEEHRLTPTDKAFLRARISFLTADEIHKYPSVFPEHATEPATVDDEQTEEQLKQQDAALAEQLLIESLIAAPIDSLNMDQLKVLAKHYNVRGWTLYKDADKLAAVITDTRLSLQ